MRVAKSAVGLWFIFCLGLAVLFSWSMPHSMGGPPLQASPFQVASLSNKTGQPRCAAPTTMSIGKALFNDINLSNPPGQSCASCHGSTAGFKFPGEKVNKQSGIPPGAVKGRFENRIPPTISYAVFLPQGPPQFDGTAEAFTGGLFWDGHATDIVNQATFPLQNPDEMNNTLHNIGDPALVVHKLQADENAWLFRQAYGNQVFNQSTATVFNLIVQAIATYEASPEVSPFSSKYDQYVNGKAKLTKSEMNGLCLVTGSTTGRPGGPAYYKNAHCVDCHGIPQTAGGIDLWTNACYDNIGVPKNLSNPYYTMTNAGSNPAGYNPQGKAYIDLGLGGAYYPSQYNLPPGNIGSGSNGQGDFLGINGDFKAPTLRNVDNRPYPGFVKRYTHNGYFTDLKTIVHFYNTRNLTTFAGEVIDFTAAQPYANLKGQPLWPAPEYPDQTTLQNPSGAFNSQGAQVGNLGLTDSEENDIVAFLKTLTDGYGQSFPTTAPSVAASASTTAAMPAMKKIKSSK